MKAETETYEQMMQKRDQIEAYFEALQNVHIDIMRSIDRANNHLDAQLRDFRHFLNDQLIDLKYGKGYKASFMYEILIQVNNL